MDVFPPRDEHDMRRALALLVERPGLSPDNVDAQVDTLLCYTRRRRISLDHCLIARENDLMVSVCLCVDGAGRMATIFIPALRRFLVPPTATVRLLEEQARQARDRQIQLLQATVGTEDTSEADVYRAAGFHYLARLIYMDSDLSRSIQLPSASLQVDWITYQDDTHPLFARVVQSTYEGSLDCVGLNGMRDIEDILASHKATGVFDPLHWLIATVAGEPAGVILLARLPERWALEVVYMGVLPVWRGRSCGIALLRHAVDLARQEALSTLTLTVDAGNRPALRLYERFGFHQTACRDVWLRRT